MPKEKTMQAKRALKKKAVRANPKSRPSKSLASRSKPAPLAVARTDFAAIFARLKGIMAAFADQLRVTADEPRKYYLVTKSNSWKGGPMFFGAVMTGRAYASYHLMPLYICPELVRTISPELKKRMQGKSCFNFREPDPALFAQLADLTEAGLEKYRARKWL